MVSCRLFPSVYIPSQQCLLFLLYFSLPFARELLQSCDTWMTMYAYTVHTLKAEQQCLFVKENNAICLLLLSWAEAAVVLVKAVDMGLIWAESNTVVCVFLQFANFLHDLELVLSEFQIFLHRRSNFLIRKSWHLVILHLLITLILCVP